MKKSLFLFVGLLLLNLGIFAGEAPESLFIKGDALAESTERMAMKKVNNTFELITSLKTGNYSFEGDDISAGNINVEGENVPYFISVSYDGDAPQVSINKISRVIAWAPFREYDICEFDYIGSSSFYVSNIIHDPELWGGYHGGDARYRIRVYLEDGTQKVYGSSDDFNMIPSTHNQWGDDENGPDLTFNVSEAFLGTGVPFNIRLTFSVEEEYTLVTSEYIPEITLFIKGSALEESDEPIKMKYINNTYEIITSLKSGNYSFEGDSNLTEEYSITVEDGSAPYYIAITYNNEEPQVKLNKIDRVIMWIPWTQKVATELVYTGNSTFKGEYLTIDKNIWGDDSRFRIRLLMEDGSFKTYGSPENMTILEVSTNGQWGGDENGAELNCSLPIKYRDPNEAFDLLVSFSPESSYNLNITNYIIDFPLCDEVWLEGTAVENGRFELRKKIDGPLDGSYAYRENVFEGVVGLQNGEYTIKGKKDGVTYNFTIENGKLVEDTQEIVVDGDLVPNYIKVNLNFATIRVSPISSFDFWYICNDAKISLDYKGDGTFIGFSDDFRLIAPWDDRLERRYKYMMSFENEYEVWWGRTEDGNMFSHYNNELSDKFEPAFQFEDDAEFRTTWSVNFVESGNYNQQYQVKRYLLEDKVPFSNQSTIENASVKFIRKGLGAGEYSTLCLPFATTLENVEVYAFSNSDENTINFEKVERVEANTPYLIKPTVNMDLIIEEENVTLEATTTESTAGDNVYHFLGTYENMAAESGMYGISPNTNSFVQAGDNVTISAFRAYLQAIDAPNAAPSLAIGIEDGGTTDIPGTSIDGLNVYAVNNVLYVVSDVRTVVNIYSIDGRLVHSQKVEAGITGITGLQQGVYIVNAQKVVIR